MRFLSLAVMGVLLSSSVMADSGGTPSHNYARIRCSQHFTCPDGTTNTANDFPALVANANACVTQNFGYTNTSSFFDEGAGLNGNCLKAIPNVLPPGAGTPLSPSCCVTQMPDNTCAFVCELNGAN